MLRGARIAIALSLLLGGVPLCPALASSIYNFSSRIDWSGLDVKIVNPILTSDYIVKNTIYEYCVQCGDKSVPDWTTPISSNVLTPHLSSHVEGTVVYLDLALSFDNQLTFAPAEQFYVRMLRNGLIDIPVSGMLTASVPFSVDISNAPQGTFPYDFAWVRSALGFERLSGGMIEPGGPDSYAERILLINSGDLSSQSASGILTIQQSVIEGETWWLSGSVDALIQPVPVPASIWLFGSGLVAISRIASRRHPGRKHAKVA